MKKAVKKKAARVKSTEDSLAVTGSFTIHGQNDLEFRLTSDKAIPVAEGLAVMLRFISSQCELYDIDLDYLSSRAASTEKISEKHIPISKAQYGLV